MALPVPAELSELSPEWVTAALAEDGRFPDVPTVTGVRLERVGLSTGFLGQLARLHLDSADGAGPSTLVAKLPTLDPGGRTVGRMLDVWNREARFFAEVAPRCRAKVPDCYYNGADPAAGRWALLLEDCGPGQDADQLKGATDAQAAEAVSALARLQGAFWDEPLPFHWMPGFHRAGFEMLQGAMTAALPNFITRYGDRVPSRTLAWLSSFVDQLPEWATVHGRGPLTLVHADYRLDNLLYAADGTVTIIDWQTALWGPGPMDLASFLATSLTIDKRRHLEGALISEYATAVGASQPHVETVYRSCLLWWMAIFANNLSRLDPADERATALFDRMIVGTFGAADDWDAGELLS